MNGQALELRRRLLKGSATALVLPWLGGALLAARGVLAAEWPRDAFTAHDVHDALKAFGAADAVESRDIVITAPEIAENGAKVEIEIVSNLPRTLTLAIFADRNPMPLCAALDFSETALPYVRFQLKLAETTRLRAVAKTSDGKHHVAIREVTVTLGGCGA